MRICGCSIRIKAGISVRVRIRVMDGVRISNRVGRRVKLVNYSLITALPIATSADPHIRFLPVAFLPIRPRGFSVRYDLNELFNIDTTTKVGPGQIDSFVLICR